MKKFILSASAILIIGLAFTACNKTKKYSKRLDGGEWTVTELSVDGTNEAELPEWEIADCDIYKESCTGEWKNEEGGHAMFVWQFREKGKTFEISSQAEEEDGHDHEHEHEHNHAEEEAYEQCFNFSGTYTVVEHKRKSMKFESTSTIGFSDKKVILIIEKK